MTLLSYSLSRLQTMHVFPQELKREELRSTAEREELQYAQIKVRIRSIYQLIAPYWRESVDIEDPFKQLQLVNNEKCFGRN